MFATARGQRLARRQRALGLAGYNEVLMAQRGPLRTVLVPFTAPYAAEGSLTDMQCCALLRVASRCTCQLLSLESFTCQRHVGSASKVLHNDGSSYQQQHLAFDG